MRMYELRQEYCIYTDTGTVSVQPIPTRAALDDITDKFSDYSAAKITESADRAGDTLVLTFEHSDPQLVGILGGIVMVALATHPEECTAENSWAIGA